MSDLELHTFGALWASRRQGTRPVFHGGNACRLLVLLAAGGGADRRRDTLAQLLWPHATEARRQHSLRQLLCDVRKRLGPDTLEESSDTLRLSPDWWVDFIEFEKAVSGARWHDAADLYGGPFGAGMDTEDSVELRARLDAVQARLHVKASHCFARLVYQALAEGDLAGAERWARSFVAIDPLAEEARRLLMQVLHAEHRDTDALGVFEEYRTYLDRLIGDDPSVGLYSLANDIGKAANEDERHERRQARRKVMSERRHARWSYPPS